MKTLLAVGLAVLLVAISTIQSETLPGSCAIIATQAYAKVENAYWRELVSYQFIDPENFPSVLGHMICIWQPFEDSTILAYNVRALNTVELGTKSHDITQIKKALAARGLIILNAHFVE